MHELITLMSAAEDYGLHSEEQMLLKDTAETIDSARPKDLIEYIESFGLIYTDEYLEHFKRFVSWNDCAMKDIDSAIEQYYDGDDTGLDLCACYFNDGISPKKDILKFLRSL